MIGLATENDSKKETGALEDRLISAPVASYSR
jgi:hypothetical protein